MVPSTATQSSDSSAISRLNAESAISEADKSKLWSWSTGQPLNASSSSSSSMQGNRSTDCVVVAAAAGGGGGRAPEESVTGRAFKGSNKAVYCASLNDWPEAARSEEASRLERRLLFLENALTEKNTEIEKLVDQLGKAHRIIANFRIEPGIAEGKALNGAAAGRVVAAEVGSSCAQNQ